MDCIMHICLLHNFCRPFFASQSVYFVRQVEHKKNCNSNGVMKLQTTCSQSWSLISMLKSEDCKLKKSLSIMAHIKQMYVHDWNIIKWRCFLISYSPHLLYQKTWALQLISANNPRYSSLPVACYYMCPTGVAANYISIIFIKENHVLNLPKLFFLCIYTLSLFPPGVNWLLVFVSGKDTSSSRGMLPQLLPLAPLPCRGIKTSM